MRAIGRGGMTHLLAFAFAVPIVGAVVVKHAAAVCVDDGAIDIEPDFAGFKRVLPGARCFFERAGASRHEHECGQACQDECRCFHVVSPLL